MPSSKRKGKGKIDEPVWIESSGNVFLDLGFTGKEAANLLLRCELMNALEVIIKERGWTQQETARRLDVRQPRVSDLMRGHIDLFSVDMLVEWLDKLGKQVHLTITDKDVA